MKIAFFDIEISGHHTEYIMHLINYIKENKYDDEYFFIVHPEFEKHLKKYLSQVIIPNNVYIISIQKEEYIKVNSSNVFINSIRTHLLLEKYIKKINAEQVFLLYLNIFILALIIFRTKYKIGGILFSQFTRMQTNSFGEKLRYFRKYWQTKFLVSNEKICSVFILNDIKTCESMNKVYGTDIFKMLPDPVQNSIIKSDYDIFSEFNIERNKIIYLHIGGLAERKGSLDILDSIEYIDKETQKKICFIIAGKPDSGIVQKLTEKVDYYKKISNMDIIYINRFIENDKMKSMFEQCHFVLIPYKNVESSSGILGHAALANKPVIGCSEGLLGELISKYNLGYTINSITPRAIAEKINITYNKYQPIDGCLYLKGREPSDFCSAIFNEFIG
jgi:glycosyltransferase involved in cell wall biosynthesis